MGGGGVRVCEILHQVSQSRLPCIAALGQQGMEKGRARRLTPRVCSPPGRTRGSREGETPPVDPPFGDRRARARQRSAFPPKHTPYHIVKVMA